MSVLECQDQFLLLEKFVGRVIPATTFGLLACFMACISTTKETEESMWLTTQIILLTLLVWTPKCVHIEMGVYVFVCFFV